MQRLIPDEEDGLLSRFIYYFIPFRRGIRNVFATHSISNSKHVAFKQLGERFIKMYDQFMQLGIVEIVVPRYHVLLFCAWLTNLNEESCDSIDNGMQGLVRRLGLIAYRIMMIFTVIRAMSESIPKIRFLMEILCSNAQKRISFPHYVSARHYSTIQHTYM